MHHALLTSLLIDTATVMGLAILVLAGLHDFAVRTVPNFYSVLLFSAGVALRLLNGGGHDLKWGMVACCVVFGITFICWRFGWMGGGDVKLLTAAAIFVAPLSVPELVASTAMAGGLLALVFVVGRRVARRPAPGRPPHFMPRILRCELWRLHRGGPLPYAAAIACGGVFATLHG